MTSQELQQVRDAYEAALRRDPEERGEFLDRACEGRPWLRAAVEALLDANPTETGLHATLEGRTIGPYIIRQEIGRGGMGVVYLTDDIRLSRRVALKALASGLTRKADGRERLRREARAAAALSHPGIATVYALEEIDGELYLACEYVPGRSLRAVLQSGPLPIHDVVEMGGQLARAIAAAHAHGIVHRDLKPENVIRTPAGMVKILDFGLARMESSPATALTQAGFIVGTPAYMAPEQARGEPVDSRSDVFAFGLLIYELASGANPFGAASITGTIARILEVEPAALARVRSDCPPSLDRIVSTCLQKNPGDRYRSTDDLVSDFAHVEAAMPARPRSGTARASGTSNAPAPSARLTPQWWWAFHQAALSAVYPFMLWPLWQVQSALRPTWGRGAMLVMLGVTACVVSGISLRWHLLFVSRFDAAELPALHARTRPWLRLNDGLFAAILLGLGVLAIDRVHSLFTMLLLAVATLVAIAAFVIEPTTTQSSFRTGSGGSGTTPPSLG